MRSSLVGRLRLVESGLAVVLLIALGAVAYLSLTAVLIVGLVMLLATFRREGGVVVRAARCAGSIAVIGWALLMLASIVLIPLLVFTGQWGS